jgi:nucleoside permease NupC
MQLSFQFSFQRINDDITIGTHSTLLKLILGLFLLYFDLSEKYAKKILQNIDLLIWKTQRIGPQRVFHDDWI